MKLDPQNIYERLVSLGCEWADAQAAAELLEENKKPLLSQLSTEIEGSAAAKEAFALRHADYKKHVEIMVNARKDANKKRVRYDSAKVWSELMRTQAANERAAMREAT